MGWLYGWRSKEELIEHLSKSDSESWKVVRSTIRGNRHWILAENADGVRWIGLNLMDGGGSGCTTKWGYKSLDESVGPYYFDCPLSFIRDASEPFNQTAKEWRESVLELARKKNARPKAAPGLKLVVHGCLYVLQRLVSESRPRLGWVVQDVDGKEWRLTTQLLLRAQLETTPEMVEALSQAKAA